MDPDLYTARVIRVHLYDDLLFILELFGTLYAALSRRGHILWRLGVGCVGVISLLQVIDMFVTT